MRGLRRSAFGAARKGSLQRTDTKTNDESRAPTGFSYAVREPPTAFGVLDGLHRDLQSCCGLRL